MRRNRIKRQGATYLITANINRFKNELFENAVKDIMLGVLAEANRLFIYKLFDFSIQDSCVKWIIKPSKGSDLSDIMQWVLSVFAIRFNRYFGIHGHVWYDRFKSRIIETPEEVEENIENLKCFPIIKKLFKKASDYFYGGAYFLERKVYALVVPFDKLLFADADY
jgi:hypothetical protein